MNFKKLICIILCIVLIFSLTSCTNNEEEKENKFIGQKIEKQTSEDINKIHLRDKKLLYSKQDPTEVVTMYLTVYNGNEGENTNHTWEEINTYSAYDYDEMGVDRYKVEGLLQVGNEEGVLAGELGYDQVSPNCTVQIRGQSSSLNAQKNYKIRLKDNKGQWRGQSTIALNKHQSDGLRFRNKLAYDLITDIDELMGLRTTFVHLYVKDTTSGGNGQFKDYGLYTQVEQLNKTALETHGLDKRGHLYKINYCEFYRYPEVIKMSDDPTYDLKAFEEILEVKGDDDHKKLITMFDKVNDYSIPMEEILKDHFDIENITYWMAFHILMGNIDTQSRNFYIYSPLNSEKWYILTWDNDASLKKEENRINNRSDASAWETGVSNYWGNVLFKRCLKTEIFRKELDKAIEKLKGYLTDEKINEKANLYANIVKPYVYRMPDLMYAPLTSYEYDLSLKSLAKEIDLNYKLYKDSFKKPMPFFIGVPIDKNGKLTVEWEGSYDFNAETITYTFELARDYTFNNPIVKEETKIPTISFDKLPKGQYFIRVSATNESGNSQYAFDYYITENGKNYGTKCFYIGRNGEVVEDISLEN